MNIRIGLLWSVALSLLLVGCKPAASQRSSDGKKADADPSKPGVASGTVRIVTWNLEWFPGHKPDAPVEAQAEQMAQAKAALANLKPDVLLLQEVRDWDSAAELCKAAPDLQVHVASRFQPRSQNQVIASKLPADSAWSESWQKDGVTPPRGYSFAAIELPGHRLLLTYSLHLKSNQGNFSEDVAQRQASAKQLLRHAGEMSALYGKRGPVGFVVGGDMNSSLDDPKFADDQTLRALSASGFYWTHEGVLFAHRTSIPAKGEYPDNCFDHIFTAGLGKPVAKVMPHPGISDHNPVVLDVDLAKADFQSKIVPAPGLVLLNQAKVETVTSAETIDVRDDRSIRAAIGQMATVKGTVQKVSSTKTSSIYFIDFVGSNRAGFVAIVRQQNLPAIVSALGGDLQTILPGKTVELKGEIVLFKERPEIIVSGPDQIKVVPE